jgi:hypothetical protein
MPRCEQNFRSLPIRPQNALYSHRAHATIIPLQPLSATGAQPSSFRRAGRSRGADPSSAAVIPIRLSRTSAPVQWVLPRSESAAKSAKRADQKLLTGEEEYRQRMFENLLAAGWVGALMTAGYYMLNVLAPSM